MNTTIPLSSPDIGQQEEASAIEVLRSGRLSLGPALPLFEEAIAQVAGTRHAVAVNSGTSGLHLCIKAAGIGPGDEVITTPFSFVASANCMLFEGAVPKFVDIDPISLNIDVDAIESAITPRTRAILPVHVFGRPCQMDKILQIAVRHNLIVIEDACEAIGATVNNKQAGSFGRSGVFAFYPNKQLTTGEGGMIVTDDAETARMCRSWRNQGRADGNRWLQHDQLGYNYRLSDINCAIGTVQARRLTEILAMRQGVASKYTARLTQMVPEVLTPPSADPGSTISWFVYVVRLRDEFSAADRDAIMQDLTAAGIGCNNYFSPIHLQPFYKDRFGHKPGDFPITEHVADRTIALPFFNRIRDSQIEEVCHALAACVAKRSRRSVVAIA